MKKSENCLPDSQELERVLEELETFAQRAAQQKPEQPGKELTLEQFVLRLSGIADCRRLRGIPQHMGHETLYFCEEEENREAARKHLRQLYGIQDKQTLYQYGICEYRAGEEYSQFRSFWDGAPVFDVGQLTPDGRNFFEKSKAFAERLRPLAGNAGLFAWDCSEAIGLCRKACACGIITPEEFWEITLPLAQQAAAWYSSWQEYAVSCLCGGVYFMYQLENFQTEQLPAFLELNRRLAENLLAEGGAWNGCGWFSFDGKEYAIPARDLKYLLPGWDAPSGCLVSDRILVDGCKVGYLYRATPAEGYPDSGWRFFAGDESPEYTQDSSHCSVCDLNTLCNYDPEVLPLLHAPYGTAYFRDEQGIFRQESLPPERE